MDPLIPTTQRPRGTAPGPHPGCGPHHTPVRGDTTDVAVKIRLKRLGKIRVPQYRIVVVDSRKKRDGRVIEEIGKYHPKEDPSYIDVVSDRAQYWLGVGAQPSDAVAAILKITGDWQKFKGEPGTEGTLQDRRAEARQARGLQRGPQGRRQGAQGRRRDQEGRQEGRRPKSRGESPRPTSPRPRSPRPTSPRRRSRRPRRPRPRSPRPRPRRAPPRRRRPPRRSPPRTPARARPERRARRRTRAPRPRGRRRTPTT